LALTYGRVFVCSASPFYEAHAEDQTRRPLRFHE